MLVLAARNPQPLLVIGFALAGLFLSVFYVAPPFHLKRHGLGELDVFLTWGPLMIGGIYLVAIGNVPAWVLVFSIPYSLLVTSGALRQAHRQDRARHRARNSHRARDPRRVARSARGPGADDPVLPAHRARRTGRLGWAVGAARRARHPDAGARAARLQLAQARRPAGLVSGRVAGRCGSSASPSATRVWPAVC